MKKQLEQSIIILADNPLSVICNPTFPKEVVCFPENGLNAKHIKSFVNDLKRYPKTIITTSLYLLREIGLQNIDCIYQNFLENGTVLESDNIAEIGDIEILDRELQQSQEYIDKECGLIK
jgi:hypothetical protein